MLALLKNSLYDTLEIFTGNILREREGFSGTCIEAEDHTVYCVHLRKAGFFSLKSLFDT